MKNHVKWISRITIVILTIVISFGCSQPGDDDVDNMVDNIAFPDGIFKAYDDADRDILYEEDGTLVYQIEPGLMPDLIVGDQIVHNGSELIEVASVIEQNDGTLVIYNIDGDIAKLFPI
jgi:hypothetical protein